MDALTALMTRTSTPRLVDPAPAGAELETILKAAASAPDHGRLRPWRFVVIAGEARERFGELLAAALQRREPEVPPHKLEAERKKPLRAPLIVAAAAEVREHPGVPEIEQVLAAGAAAENLLLAAHALGFGGFWRTGASAYDPSVRQALGLAPTARLVGFLYLGSVGMPGRTREVDLSDHVTHWTQPA